VADYVSVKLIRPAVFAVTAIIMAGLLIVGIGNLLLDVYDPDFTKEYARKELWIGVGLTLLILAVAAFLSSRPAGALGPLDDEVAIGSTAMTGEDLTPVDPYARYGALGSVTDVAPGYTLYARNGGLAVVTDILRSVEDIGDLQRTLLYSKGLSGAPKEIWVPIEAVTTVYPETQSAFLAIAGDEIEALGWNRPPASFVRAERSKETPLY
jgi:hypothetical protein